MENNDDEEVTIELSPHTTTVITDYISCDDLDTDVSLSAFPTSVDEMEVTLTRKELFDVSTTMLDVDDGLRPEHYGRRIMRLVHNEVN